MPQLQFKNVNAPNLTGTANILKQASDQLTGALSGGAKILQDYTKGQQDKADGKVVAEIAKLSTEEEITKFLNSDTVQGKPLSPAMQETVLGLRKNLLGLQAQRASIDSTKTNTDGTRQRNQFIGLEGELLGAKVAGQLVDNRLTGERVNTESINNETLRDKNALGLKEQRSGIRTNDANTLLINANTENQSIKNLTQSEKDQLDLDATRSKIKATDAGTLLTGVNTESALIDNLTRGEANRAEIDGVVSRTRGTNANTRLTGTQIQENQIDNLTRGENNRAIINASNANTAQTLLNTEISGDINRRSESGFQNNLTDRTTRLSEEAETKRKRKDRDTVALSALNNSSLVTKADVVKAVAANPLFENDPTAAINAVNRVSSLIDEPTGSLLSPGVSDSTASISLDLAASQINRDIEINPQTKLFSEAERYKVDPAKTLTEEFGLEEELFDEPKESLNRLRIAINDVAREAKVTTAQAAIAMRESFSSADPLLQFNNVDNQFDTKKAVEFARTYFSPEASARYDRKIAISKNALSPARKTQTELNKVLNQIEKTRLSEKEIPETLLEKRRNLQNKFSQQMKTATSILDNAVTPTEAVPPAASSNEIFGPTPTDLNQSGPYLPRYADEETADYVQQLLLEQARKFGTVQ